MTAIVRSDPPMRVLHRDGIIWCTTHHCADGSTFDTYEHDEERGLCGLRNRQIDRLGIHEVDSSLMDVFGKRRYAGLGRLHPQCVRCHTLGHCKDLCPVEVPGFVCTASMDPESQEAGWGALRAWDDNPDKRPAQLQQVAS